MNLIETNKDKFDKLYELYSEYNSHTNISAIRDKDSVYKKHFEDSLVISDYLFNSIDLLPNRSEQGLRVRKNRSLPKVNEIFEDEHNAAMGDFVTSLIDIGTGGGFPAIPLAICFPKCKITAVDSIGKKTKFIDLVKDELKLNNLEIITARAEELAHDKSQREQYDLVVSRAVAELKVLLELTCPFAKVNSRLIAYKKFPIQEELLDAKKIISDLDLELEATETYLDDRQLLIFRKSSKTKSEYPRQMSKIKSKKVTKR